MNRLDLFIVDRRVHELLAVAQTIGSSSGKASPPLVWPFFLGRTGQFSKCQTPIDTRKLGGDHPRCASASIALPKIVGFAQA
jgi:hypothetical protein